MDDKPAVSLREKIQIAMWELSTSRLLEIANCPCADCDSSLWGGACSDPCSAFPDVEEIRCMAKELIRLRKLLGYTPDESMSFEDQCICRENNEYKLDFEKERCRELTEVIADHIEDGGGVMELKPCPFCGNPAKLVWQAEYSEAVACVNDECIIGPDNETGPYCWSAKAWNRRSTEAALATRVAELEADKISLLEQAALWRRTSDANSQGAKALREERDRLREALEKIAERDAMEDPSTEKEIYRLSRFQCAQIARAALTPMEEKP